MGNIGLKCFGSSRRSSGTSNSRITNTFQVLSEIEKAIAKKGQSQQNNENMMMSKEETSSASAMPPVPYLPPEIIFDILTRLPVKSLLMLSCVCKDWHDLIQNRQFIDMHYLSRKRHYFHQRFSCDGLSLVYEANASQKYSIVNEAMRKKLVLPNPQDNRISVTLSFVPSLGEYKVVCIYDTKQEIISERCEIMTAGIDNSWRPIEIPMFHNFNRKRVSISVVAIGAVVHCIRVSKVGSEICQEILSLDLETETFTHFTLPENLSPALDKFWPFDWNGNLAFAYSFQEPRKPLVLEDYKKLKWGTNQILMCLDFTKASAASVGNRPSNNTWFFLMGEKLYTFNLESGKLVVARPQGSETIVGRDMCDCTHSLVALRGMQPF